MRLELQGINKLWAGAVQLLRSENHSETTKRAVQGRYLKTPGSAAIRPTHQAAKLMPWISNARVSGTHLKRGSRMQGDRRVPGFEAPVWSVSALSPAASGTNPTVCGLHWPATLRILLEGLPGGSGGAIRAPILAKGDSTRPWLTLSLSFF